MPLTRHPPNARPRPTGRSYVPFPPALNLLGRISSCYRISACYNSVMGTIAQDLLVLAESPMKSVAIRFARRLGATPQAIEFNRLKPSSRIRRFLVYLEGGEPADEVRGVLRTVSKHRYEILVLYSAARAPETAAKWGMVLGEMRPKHAHLCFEAGQVANFLHLKRIAEPAINVAAIRKQLGLTQQQLA